MAIARSASSSPAGRRTKARKSTKRTASWPWARATRRRWATEVRLTIQPANTDGAERRVVSLIREEIKLEDQEVKAKVIELPNGHDKTVRLGVIDLPSFYATIEVAGRPTDLAGGPGGGGTR